MNRDARRAKDLTGRFSQDLNRRYSWDGPVFRGRFRNRVASDDAYWAHLLAYVHLNPVRAGLVSRPAQAPWTSHGAYVGARTCPNWLTTDELLGLHGGVNGYLDYVSGLLDGSTDEPANFESEGLWRPDESDVCPELPMDPPVDCTLGVSRSIIQVAVATGLRPEEIMAAGRGRRGNPARWVAAWWLTQHAAIPPNAVAAVLGMSPSTVSKMRTRVQARRHSDPEIKEWVRSLEMMERRKREKGKT